MLTGGIGLAVMFPVVAPLVGSAQTAGTTGILALVGSGVGVGAANGVQGSVAARQQKAEASAATEKIKVHCPISYCAHKQRIEVPVSINLHGRSWSCVECAQPFELRQCNNCFELGTAPFLATGGAANELESGLQAADRARMLTGGTAAERRRRPGTNGIGCIKKWLRPMRTGLAILCCRT